MMMPGRNTEHDWSRMGYNGQAKDDEVYGKGNLNTALFWEYDTRRFGRWNVDPITSPSSSPYAVFNGNPILYNDLLGDTPPIGGAIAAPRPVTPLIKLPRNVGPVGVLVSLAQVQSDRITDIYAHPENYVDKNGKPLNAVAQHALNQRLRQKVAQDAVEIVTGIVNGEYDEFAEKVSGFVGGVIDEVKGKFLQSNGGGKNAAHANQKAREAAEKRYQEAKQEYEQMKSKPNKTPEDKKQLKKLENTVKSEKKKMDFTGENHSQKAKGR